MVSGGEVTASGDAGAASFDEMGGLSGTHSALVMACCLDQM